MPKNDERSQNLNDNSYSQSIYDISVFSFDKNLSALCTYATARCIFPIKESERTSVRLPQSFLRVFNPAHHIIDKFGDFIAF